MVERIYVEKRPELAKEARDLLQEARTFLGLRRLEGLRILNRYDVEGLTPQVFRRAVPAVFSEPQVDRVWERLDLDGAAAVFAVEYLPGQYDQRADSAAQCVQILTQGERPLVRTARVYLLYGPLEPGDVEALKRHVLNPVEAREASLEKPQTLAAPAPSPAPVEVLAGFRALDPQGRSDLGTKLGLAMDSDDLALCQAYFQAEDRDPTLTELRVLDTYWSDHCRHTTFQTALDQVTIQDPLLKRTYENYLQIRRDLGRTGPVTLMDLGTLAAKYLRARGKLPGLDESEEINACTVRTTVHVDGRPEPWLLLFKNETHNHPTEIEPFGGAATCIGGAIRDPLASRAYVYGAMRLTGAADPLTPVDQTLPGKLPQRKIVTAAAAGYSSYGNQIGLATGLVDELYHPGYAAKRMEIGAVVAAVPEANVKRARPEPGDQVILLGGRTGRDGCGGATGSSKRHDLHSLETCGAEVQKGNPPEERKLQRLFRNPAAARLIKRCNDFGAGGVSVAIGELAGGLSIDLDRVPKKYQGLDGTELAISESQERMAVVVAPGDADRFLDLAAAENLEATAVAQVTGEPRLRISWQGRTIVDLSRAFLDTNGAEKHASATLPPPQSWNRAVSGGFTAGYKALAGDLNVCSKQGLSERFDSTIGAGTVLMPFGGQYQRTPIQAMVHKISLEHGHTQDCSLMAWGYNPDLTERSPYHGAYLAVVESVAKLVATGAGLKDTYLSFQEYFPQPGRDPQRWGLPTAALLGAFRAQLDLEVAAIGGKDSMSGSFEDLDVPPTLVSFAVTTAPADRIRPNPFQAPNHTVCLLTPELGPDGLPQKESLTALFRQVADLLHGGGALSAYTPGFGGPAEAVLKMALGNGLGFRFDRGVSLQTLFGYAYGGFVLELPAGAVPLGTVLGRTTDDGRFTYGDESLSLSDLLELYAEKLEPVYPTRVPADPAPMETFTAENTAARPGPRVRLARPRALIPVFPGTNCEYDTARALEDAGALVETFLIRNRSPEDIARSVEDFARALGEAQLVFLPGGFSGGDEPDGSGKLITAFFRNQAVREQLTALLDRRDGLLGGICNGFQALIKLGLLPYGKILDVDEACPTLTFNTIGRHQSRLVRVRVASNRSPWLAKTQVGEIYTVPISHGEGRFWAEERLVRDLAARGQIATQYVDFSGRATADVAFNPNGSAFAVEGLTSPDGRIFGKMGHAERVGPGLYKNVPGRFDMGLFASAVQYFQTL